MTLCISSELHRRLLCEAAATPDVEVCGLLIGTDSVERIIPAMNVADGPATAFEIDPATLFQAIRTERNGGERLLGYYHSHPTGPPAPSAFDSAQAKNDRRIWVIVGRQRMTAWQMTNANEFSEIKLQISD